MKIKYQTKEYTIEMKDLDPPTIGSLKKQMKETINGIKDVEMERLSLFHKKVKLPANDDLELGDEKVQITDDSIVFLIITKAPGATDEKRAAEKAKSAANIPQQNPYGFGSQPNDSQFMHNPNMFNAMNSPNMYGAMNNQHGMGGPTGLEKHVIDQIVNNPDSIMQMMESQMPNMPEEQKAFLRSNIEVIKKNPEMIKQIMNSQMSNPMFNNQMMGNPMMGNPMMQSPMMNNPMMNNPMMQSPMMNNPYYMPPPPQNGPCFHGFYPLKNADGKLEQQDAKDVYAQKIASLKDMGFLDEEDNLRVLIETKGDISAAIDTLTKKEDEKK